MDNQLVGANKHFLYDNLPNIRDLLASDLDELVSKSELILCFTSNTFIEDYIDSYPEKTFLDLTINRIDEISSENYMGLTW